MAPAAEYAEVGNAKKGGRTAWVPWALAALFLCSTIALAVAFGVERQKRLDAAPAAVTLSGSSTGSSSGAKNATASIGSSNSSNSSDSPSAPGVTRLACANAEAFKYTSFSNKTAALFNAFTASELDEISALVRGNLSLAAAQPEDMIGDWLYGIENLPTPKTAALAYLDGAAEFPGRFARAIVVFASNESTARVTEYRVGPIRAFPLAPFSVAIAAMVVPPPHNSTSIPYNMRPVTGVEYDLMEEHIAAGCKELDQLFLGSYNETYDSGAFWWTDSAPRGFNRSERLSWLWLTWNVEVRGPGPGPRGARSAAAAGGPPARPAPSPCSSACRRTAPPAARLPNPQPPTNHPSTPPAPPRRVRTSKPWASPC
jgi:hypothetical protein